MSQASGIEWTDYTWNPTRGCSRVSEGCRHCYAEKVATRFSGPGQPYEGLARFAEVGGRREARWTGEVKLIKETLRWPLRTRRSAEKFADQHGRRPRVFVNSMSDLFHERLTNEQIEVVFAAMAAAPWYGFQVLTKRAARMSYWMDLDRGDRPAVAIIQDALRLRSPRNSPAKDGYLFAADDFASASTDWPLPHIALGVSVEDQATADERIPHLLRCPASWRFVSYEPALGPVNFQQIRDRGAEGDDCLLFPLAGEFICDGRNEPLPIAGGGISQVIIGGESGPGARPFNLEWARSVIRQCADAGVPVFVKQLGAAPVEEGCAPGYVFVGRNPASLLRVRHAKGGDPSEWPADLQVQQFPEGL